MAQNAERGFFRSAMDALVEARARQALPAGEPGDDLLKPAEAARRLGERVLPLPGGLRGRLVRLVEIRAGFAEGVQAGELGHGDPSFCPGMIFSENRFPLFGIKPY